MDFRVFLYFAALEYGKSSTLIGGYLKNSPFAICTNLLTHICVMKIPEYTKYSGISITLFGSKSLTQIIKKEVLEVAKRIRNLYNEDKSTIETVYRRKRDLDMTQKPRNADYTKEYNRKAVLRILRHNAMSRAELARATGLTRAATSLIVEELVNDGIVTELTPQSVGRGRSATPLALRTDCYYALAVDLSRTGCSVGLCDIAGNLLQSQKIPDQNNLVEAIIAELKAMLETVDRSKVLGIGISSPGPLDSSSGRILNPPQFERWHGVEISRHLSEELDMPAYLERDVCALALHQLEMGRSQNFMLLFVGIGIGAAIMSEGKLLGNSGYFTGELGHTTIRFDGRLCKCGNRGCLETYASIPALLTDRPFSGWKDLMDHVDTNPDAYHLLDQEAVYLSAGLVNLLNLIPVDTIYLAGDICYRYELLAQRLQREIHARVLDQSKGTIHIYPSIQDKNIGILAAAEVVFSRFFTI